ncbi:peptidyl-prolyl cis-trans isomerase FKBP2-like [Ptychodera flava]|uniref:peptidyl-prolyl cis-trans isomerase FKBP2-like n=1 Tax=Ptychodera flava TaxID=63121 RepID=UPI00396A5B75
MDIAVCPAFGVQVFFTLTNLGLLVVGNVEVEGFKVVVTHRPRHCPHTTAFGDSVMFEYNGTLEDGTIFDSSYIWGEPFAYVIGDEEGQLIKGWVRGVKNMCASEIRRITIPPLLGYGRKGSPPLVPSNSTLTFDVKLVKVVKGATYNYYPPHDPPSPNYEALQFLAIPFSVILFVLVAVCLYSYEHRGKKIKWYRVGDSV